LEEVGVISEDRATERPIGIEVEHVTEDGACPALLDLIEEIVHGPLLTVTKRQQLVPIHEQTPAVLTVEANQGVSPVRAAVGLGKSVACPIERHVRLSSQKFSSPVCRVVIYDEETLDPQVPVVSQKPRQQGSFVPHHGKQGDGSRVVLIFAGVQTTENVSHLSL
jgi:hypothetical protein